MSGVRALVPVLLLGCGSAERPATGTASGGPPPPPADSLVMTAPGGAEVWFTLARRSVSADGIPCMDRAIEIRRGDAMVQVPLLYTGSAPELVNDTTLRARLSNHCVPGDAYLVDLRTGRPVRAR